MEKERTKKTEGRGEQKYEEEARRDGRERRREEQKEVAEEYSNRLEFDSRACHTLEY